MGEIFKNCHFVITTMAGDPLLVLQEQFRCAPVAALQSQFAMWCSKCTCPRRALTRVCMLCACVRSWMDYKYDLFRLDPRRPGVHIPVCRIRRHWTMFAITDQYSVQVGQHACRVPVW